MATFEIINPSDHCTLVADDFEVAAVACVVIGAGKLALKETGCEGTPRTVPIFLLGGHDEWFAATFGRTLDASLTLVRASKLDALVACLESVALGRRDLYDRLIRHVPYKDRGSFREEWIDAHRTSQNNIAARAHRLAEQFRAEIKVKFPKEEVSLDGVE